MKTNHGQTKNELTNEIAVAHGVVTILSDTGEPQLPRDAFTIENESRPGQCSGTQRQKISARKAITNALHVTMQCFHLAQKVMSERDRLSALQMGIAREDGLTMLFRPIEQRLL